MTNVQKLLRLVRKQSGYAHGRIWEPGTDYDKANRNYPFKPQFIPGGPWDEDYERRADHWDGGLTSWDDALKQAKVGTVLDFYVTKVGDELETNIEVWIKSETEAVWTDCGSSQTHTVKI